MNHLQGSQLGPAVAFQNSNQNTMPPMPMEHKPIPMALNEVAVEIETLEVGLSNLFARLDGVIQPESPSTGGRGQQESGSPVVPYSPLTGSIREIAMRLRYLNSRVNSVFGRLDV